MFKRLTKTMSVLAAAVGLLAASPATASAGEAPQYAVGNYALASTKRPPCYAGYATCALSLTASSSIVSLPAGATYCKDPGHRVLAASLDMDCFLQVSGVVSTSLLCRANEKVFESVDITYRSSTGREFTFVGVLSSANGDGYFDGSAIDTTTGTGLVHVSGVLTNLCYTSSQESVYPPWGMKGKIHYTHVEV